MARDTIFITFFPLLVSGKKVIGGRVPSSCAADLLLLELNEFVISGDGRATPIRTSFSQFGTFDRARALARILTDAVRGQQGREFSVFVRISFPRLAKELHSDAK